MASSLKPSTWRQAFAAWFWTNALATLLIALFMFRFALTDATYQVGIEPIIVGAIGTAAALLSLPVAVLAYFLFRRILSFRSRTNRIAGLALAILAIFGLITIAIRFITTDREIDYNAFFIGFTYFPASLLVNAFVYRRELFRPDGYTIFEGNS